MERKEGDRRRTEVRTEDDNAMTISVEEEATAFSAGDNRVYSNGENKKDKCSGSERVRTRCQGSS